MKWYGWGDTERDEDGGPAGSGVVSREREVRGPERLRPARGSIRAILVPKVALK